MSKRIDITIPPQEWEMMKYNTIPSSYSKQQKQERLDIIINSRQMIYAEKYDGDLGRFIINKDKVLIQTRTISKKTGNYGELQEKIAYITDFKNKFDQETVFLGEVYLPHKTSKEIGAILRCNSDKALLRQKENPIYIYIFDVLEYEGKFLTETPMIERIQYLPKVCEKINNPQVSYAKYYEANENNFYSHFNEILQKGGEGVVLYQKNFLPCLGRSSVWETIKVKRELALDADVFITGIAPGKREYTGGNVEEWNLWQNTRTGELLNGNYYTEYSQGGCYEPVSKTYFFGLPGSIECSVYDDDGNEVVLCYCSNLTDEFRRELRDHYERYDHVAARVSGMAISTTKNKGKIEYSIRHPKFLGIREDYDIKDCKLSKLI